MSLAACDLLSASRPDAQLGREWERVPTPELPDDHGLFHRR
jgi:hypothetical protein